MEKKQTAEELVQQVIRAYAQTSDPRWNEIFSSLVRHLHAFVNEVRLTEAEWMAAIQFLTATGQACNEKRQEFILLSDSLGVSTAVNAINHDVPAGLTEAALLGPFYVPGSREIENGESIVLKEEGERTLVRGRVLDAQGKGVANAVVDVWQAAPNKFYAIQEGSGQPEMNLRGRLRTRSDGSFSFITVKPPAYPVPTDGPVGRMLNAAGRHPMRPAHIHFMIGAPGYETLTTQLFTHDDPYIESDAVFGVKPSLLVEYRRNSDPGLGVQWLLDHDFVLKAA